ncbi:type III PLP-dependent enzyme [Crossiella sp. SN42]|uniref:type III PLP-dependent enzyme n=1 Tax=Crossiella sp. SN42 TaxID=2944808 RepID=UPI00207CE492|nr:type III PLP-dependent enzyme [Crossiella sp. SN42]MCO1580270.1 type III PLP-dependent enzyme [Crossiella sp. SN42]
MSDPAALARRYGTPAYLYDLAQVRAAHAKLSAALPQPSTLHYSLKANPHPELVRQLAELGCHAEVSSTGELDTAVLAGVAAPDILHTGPGKTPAELRHALSLGVRRFSVESAAQLRLLDEIAGQRQVRVSCLLRVNAGRGAGGKLRMGGVSQFGIELDQLLAEPAAFRGTDFAVVNGLHLFPVSGVDDPAALLETFAISARAARQVAEAGFELAEVDLGGGFATPYLRPGDPVDYRVLRGELESLLEAELPGWREQRPRISFESGRYLVGSCGTYVCAVTDVKANGERTFVVLDGGINHLGGLSGIGRMLPTRAVAETLTSRAESSPRVPVDLVGPLCTPADVLSRNLELPEVRAGDLIAIRNAGAYGLSASLLGFLSHPAPVEVVLDGGTVRSASAIATVRTEVHAAQDRAGAMSGDPN